MNQLEQMTYENLCKLITEIKNDDMIKLIHDKIKEEMQKRGLI